MLMYALVLQLLFSPLIFSVFPQLTPCNRWSKSRLMSVEDSALVCNRLRLWEEQRDCDDPSELDKRLTPKQKAYLDFIETCRAGDCLDFRFSDDNDEKRDQKKKIKILVHSSCLYREHKWRPKFCTKLKLNEDERKRLRLGIRRKRGTHRKITKRSVRKEYRMMSDKSRWRFHSAMNKLKTAKVDGVSKWDLLVRLHYPKIAPNSHWGPSFLPWHREYLRQMESALINIDHRVALPYWDSTLDSPLPDARDGVLWSGQLLGNGNNYVKSGPAKDWITTVSLPGSKGVVKKLFRRLGWSKYGKPMIENIVEWLLTRSHYEQLTFCVDKTFEYLHGGIHMWVGGFMYNIRYSPNDPVFFLHHAFLDYLWELFRKNRQSRFERENEFPNDTQLCIPEHGMNRTMKPFKLLNRDGLSNKYTDFWYHYKMTPKCGKTMPTCHSKYLFCDRHLWRCLSKVQIGGNCTGFEHSDICHESICRKGICQWETEPEIDEKSSEMDSVSENVYWTKVLLIGDEGRPMMDPNAKVEVTQIGGEFGKRNVARPLRRVEYPEFPGIVYISLPRPTHQEPHKSFIIRAEDQYKRYCQPFCRNDTKFQLCQGELNLNLNWNLSSNFAFSHSLLARRFLNVNFTRNPIQWTIKLPYLIFLCEHETSYRRAYRIVNEAAVPRIDEYIYAWFPVLVFNKTDPFMPVDAILKSINMNNCSEIYSTNTYGIFHSNVVHLRANSPYKESNNVTKLRVTVRSKTGESCQLRCLKNDGWNRRCSGKISLYRGFSYPESLSFSLHDSDKLLRHFLGWSLISMPDNWTRRLSPLRFYC